MINFFHNNKIIFYLTNFFLIVLYIFPGSLPGLVFYGDKEIQPQITPDFIISTNHLYAFLILSALGFLTYKKSSQLIFLSIYLIFLSISLEVMHYFIPERSFEFPDLFGNLSGVIIVIIISFFLKKYEIY